MWIFDKYSPYSYQNNMDKYEDDEEKRFFDLRECFWFCMTSLTPQGGGEAPKNVSGRLVAGNRLELIWLLPYSFLTLTNPLLTTLQNNLQK